MSFLKIFTPSELDYDKQNKIQKKKERALAAKKNACESLSRFQESLLELEQILEQKKKPHAAHE